MRVNVYFHERALGRPLLKVQKIIQCRNYSALKCHLGHSFHARFASSSGFVMGLTLRITREYIWRHLLFYIPLYFILIWKKHYINYPWRHKLSMGHNFRCWSKYNKKLRLMLCTLTFWYRKWVRDPTIHSVSVLLLDSDHSSFQNGEHPSNKILNKRHMGLVVCLWCACGA